MQVYRQLPVQKLSGYSYDADDSEPYPCYSLPVPEVDSEPEIEIDLEQETTAAPTPVTAQSTVINAQAARRGTRSFYYGPVNQKNDVYSIFKVEHLSLVSKYIDSNMNVP